MTHDRPSCRLNYVNRLHAKAVCGPAGGAILALPVKDGFFVALFVITSVFTSSKDCRFLLDTLGPKAILVFIGARMP